MNKYELLIGVLAALLIIFVALAFIFTKQCISMYNKIQKLETENAELKHSVKSLKTENNKLHRLVYVTPDAQRITALKLSLHLKDEEICELKDKIRKQNVLLKQKWEGSKKCI